MTRNILEVMQQQLVLADGGMGTLLTARGLKAAHVPAPMLNVGKPSVVSAIHREYIAAGAQVIETNSHGASRVALDAVGLGDKSREILLAAARLAREAAGDAVWVAGAIGPLPKIAGALEVEERRKSYYDQAQALMEGGADLLLLETFSELEDLVLAITALRSVDTRVPLIAQMAFTLNGSTASGVKVREMVAALEGLAVRGVSIDGMGANCGGGEAAALHVAREFASLSTRPLSIFPNRGLADLDEQGRPVYMAGPEYFAQQCVEIAACGINLIGGCCGTTPQDIAAAAALLADRTVARRKRRASSKLPVASTIRIDRQTPIIATKPKGICVIAEVDPPRGLNYGPQLEGAYLLHQAGVDSITIADNPLSVMRLSNLAMAALILREIGANVTLHVACRDRNLIGTQSHLLGAAALGITNILAVTGDPVATQTAKGASGVFDVASINLIKIIRSMNEGAFAPDEDKPMLPAFCIGGAFNSGVRSLEAEAKKAKRKVDNGMHFIMTQPVYDTALAHRILDLLEPLGVRVFIGVMPLVSGRNAEFLHNEVPGITIPDAVRARMDGKRGKEGRDEGLKLAMELCESIAPRSRALYLITPMDRYAMVAELARFTASLGVGTRQ